MDGLKPKQGMDLVDFIVTVLVVVVLSAMLVGFLMRKDLYAASCCDHLRQIDAATKQFALEHHLTNGTPVNFPYDLTPYFKPDGGKKILHCSQAGSYSVSKVGEPPTCSLGTTVTPPHVLQ